MEKVKYAVSYGADAVYCGVPDFSLRTRINNFTPDTLKEAVEAVHAKKKKIYITLNIYAHNAHLVHIEEHLKFLRTLKIDGVIVSDPGIIRLVKKNLPRVDIHLSTQANATNVEAVKFWASNGVTRVVLAREVTLAEIREIKKAVPKMELEYFIHGAMCMSYSGRCILSKWMSGKSANLGDCTQPCRWAYRNNSQCSNEKTEADEEIDTTRIIDDKGKFEVDLEEDQHGTYFFNSKDLNLSAHIADLVEAGVTSFKIEGRAKSVYYVSVVTRAYCKIIDAIGKRNFKEVVSEQQKELDTLVNRGYTKGFLLGAEPEHNFEGKLSETPWKFCGVVEGKSAIGGSAYGRKNIGKKIFNVIFAHNEMSSRDSIEAVFPKKNLKVKIKKILNYKLEKVLEIHGGHENRFFVQFDEVLPKGVLLRRRIAK